MASLYVYRLTIPYLREAAGRLTPAEYIAQHKVARGKPPEWIEREAQRLECACAKIMTELCAVKEVATPSGGKAWVFVEPDDIKGPGWRRKIEKKPTGTYLWVTRRDGRGLVFDITDGKRQVVGISTAEGHWPREMDWAWVGSTIPPWEPKIGLAIFSL
jgi:hypothetical protein